MALAQKDRYRKAADQPEKISSYLKDEIAFLKRNRHYDYDVPVIVRLKNGASRSLSTRLGKTRRLVSVNGYSTRLKADEIDTLLASEDVERVSIDSVVKASKEDDLR